MQSEGGVGCVQSIAKHPSEDIFATGEVGKTPNVHVWRVGSQEEGIQQLCTWDHLDTMQR